MNLIVSIGLNESASDGSVGPVEVARRLRHLASEIETNVSDFAAYREGQLIAGVKDDGNCHVYLGDL